MIDVWFPVALRQLFAAQVDARLRRAVDSFTSRKRIVFSSLAVVLALVWMGNAALAVLMREPAQPESLRQWIGLGLLAYAVWHLIRVSYRRPEQGTVWTPQEEALLVGGPFHRSQLLIYRFMGIMTSAVIKAGLFVVLMLPDFKHPIAALGGAFLALSFLELWRMLLEISAAGMPRRYYTACRVVILATVAAAVGFGIVRAIGSEGNESAGSLGLVLQSLQSIAELRHTVAGAVVAAPFHVFAHLITTQTLGIPVLGWLGGSVCLVLALAWLVIRIDQFWFEATRCRERLLFERRPGECSGSRQASIKKFRLPRVNWLGGAGPLVWRQLLGVRGYAAGLLIALAAPAVLSCLPLLAFTHPRTAFVNVVGALTFYSFLLLPAALKFDFQRDLQRMWLLKSLPIRPTALVLGQIATPVLVASAFQSAVLLIAVLIRPVPPSLVLTSLLILIPLNVIIFALENLIFLLCPYRLNEEGVRIFLRSTLTFTGKAVLFALALGAVFGWSVLAHHLVEVLRPLTGQTLSPALFFALGLCLMLVATAAATAAVLVGCYQRFDPARDIPN